jgi:hypothetical protein
MGACRTVTTECLVLVRDGCAIVRRSVYRILLRKNPLTEVRTCAMFVTIINSANTLRWLIGNESKLKI